MYIKHIGISSFGPLVDREFDLSRGLNVLYGNNESGKTSLVMFIKFILYGLSTSRTSVGERQKYVNRKTGEASGYAVVVTDDGRELKVNRTLSVSGGKNRETVGVTDAASGVPVPFSGTVGEFLLGVPEQVFINTAFVGQQTGIRPEDEPIKRSVENIASAGDEKINVKKALSELDRARINLLHKNKNGGKLYELEQKRRALRDAVEEDKSNSEETVRVEASLDEIRKKLAGAEKNSKEFDELFSALEALSKCRILDAEERAAEDLRITEGALGELKSSCDLPAVENSVRVCERSFDAVRIAGEKLDAIPEPDERFIPDDEDDDFEDSPIEDIGKAEKLSSGARALSITGIVFAVAAVAGGVAAALFGTVLERQEWFFIAAGAALLAVIAVVFFAFASKKKTDLKYILGTWDAPSLEALSESVKETVRARKENIDLKKRREEAQEDLEAAQRAAEDARGTLAEAASALSVDTAGYDGGEDLLEAVKASIDEKKRATGLLESEKASLEGKLSVLREQISGIDREQVRADAAESASTEAGKRAAQMDADEIKEAARKRDFCRGSLIEMRKKETELDRRLVELRAIAKSPADTAERLERLDALTEELRLRHDAYVTAYEALSRAGDNMRSGVLPTVRENASMMMKEISGGKYRALSVSPEMDLYYSDEADTLDVGYLSSGTEDAAYLSLRLALIKALFPEDGESPPAIFDESFSRIDEKRLDSALSLICSDSFGLQSILCTCREEEAGSAERHGGRVIRM